MSRMNPLKKEERTGKAGELLGMIEKKLGRVPNMMATLAHSPAALEAYMNMSGALGGGKITAPEREAIALLVGTANSCNYCIAAHSKIGAGAGLSDADISGAKVGKVGNARMQSILNFANEVVTKKGFVSDGAVTTARNAKLTDPELLEIIGAVSLNIYTNYLNHFMDPQVDF